MALDATVPLWEIFNVLSMATPRSRNFAIHFVKRYATLSRATHFSVSNSVSDDLPFYDVRRCLTFVNHAVIIGGKFALDCVE